jgi:small subunit ribosomal protein S8
MAVTDSIGDMLTRIRNAAGICSESVEMPYSKMKENIAKVLKEEGFVSKYESPTKTGKKILRVILKYRPGKKQVINSLKRVSKPGRRVYAKSVAIPRVLSGFGIAILSTPKGIMADSEARAQKVGGEVLCYVW